MIGRYLGTWGLNWGKGTGARTEARVVYETSPMGLATPFISTVTRAIRDREEVRTLGLVPDEAPLVHLGRQVPRPLHVPWKQFGRLLKRQQHPFFREALLVHPSGVGENWGGAR